MSAGSAAHQRTRRRVLAALACALAPQMGRTQDRSGAALTFIIPAPSGVSTDRLGRIVAEGLAEILEVRITVENIPGDSGVIGTNAIAAGARNGTLLGLGVSSAMIGGKLLSRSAKFNPIEDFQWLTILGTFPTAMVLPAGSPYTTIVEWLRAARQASPPWVYASVGTGSAGHLAGAYLRLEHGAKLAHRSVESREERYALLSEGKVDALFDGTPNAIYEGPRKGHRIVAVTSGVRQSVLPDVISFGELWQQSFETWIGLVTPKHLENVAYYRLASALGVFLGDSRYADRMRAAGMSYMGLSGRGTTAFLEAEFLRLAKLIATLNQEGQRG